MAIANTIFTLRSSLVKYKAKYLFILQNLMIDPGYVEISSDSQTRAEKVLQEALIQFSFFTWLCRR
jgi:hypothetical protein